MMQENIDPESKPNHLGYIVADFEPWEGVLRFEGKSSR